MNTVLEVLKLKCLLLSLKDTVEIKRLERTFMDLTRLINNSKRTENIYSSF